jgi:hypothetical protein
MSMKQKQKSMETGSKGGAARTEHDDKTYAHCDEWANALRLWRPVPADGFGPDHRAAVAECMRRTSSTIDTWRAAIHGDAPSAIRLALRIERSSQITARTDLTMTVLLNCALSELNSALHQSGEAPPAPAGKSPDFWIHGHRENS